MKDMICIDDTNKKLESLIAIERVKFGVELFGKNAVILSSMQKTSSVLMHFFSRLGLDNEILFVNTGNHFPETLKISEEFKNRYGLNIIDIHPKWEAEKDDIYMTLEGQQLCCMMKKIVPFLEYMKQSGHKCAFGGLRAEEGGRRANLDYIVKDPRFNGYKINPIVDWTLKDVDDYLSKNDVPVHPLHAKGYPSIGCMPCTTQVLPGEDARAGRWRHLRELGSEYPTYCGLNLSDMSNTITENKK